VTGVDVARTINANDATSRTAEEALFLTDSGAGKYRGELRFRLALRAAAFIQGDEPRSTYSLMRKAYDLRSQIVHGGDTPTVSAPYNDLRTFNYSVTEAMRRALRRYVSREAVEAGKGSVLEPDENLLPARVVTPPVES